jgi:hypothetical protein
LNGTKNSKEPVVSWIGEYSARVVVVGDPRVKQVQKRDDAEVIEGGDTPVRGLLGGRGVPACTPPRTRLEHRLLRRCPVRTESRLLPAHH